MKKILALNAIFLFILSCNLKQKENPRHNPYSVENLLKYNSNKTYISDSEDGHILEVRDVGIENDSFSGGTYSFFSTGGLQYYYFITGDNKYRYSEEYDSLGKLVKINGNILVRRLVLSKKRNDSVFFAFVFFSLNKKYIHMKIFTNKDDTVKPVLLYKSDNYTNMKCAPFGLPAEKVTNDLIIYTKCTFIDTFNHLEQSFVDTANDLGVKFLLKNSSKQKNSSKNTE